MAEQLENKKESHILQKKKILVLSGGGMKGISHIGALQALHDVECLQNIEIFAGTSAGALMATLIVAGYTPSELYNFVYNFELMKLGSVKYDNLLYKFGLDDGNNIVNVLTTLLEHKGFTAATTLKEFYEKTQKKIIITATCINDKKIHYHDYEKYPDMNLIKAVRMSISVPIYFTPVEHDGMLYVDGACIDNYPISLFGERLDEVIGIFLCDTTESVDKIDSIETTIYHTFLCFNEGITALLLNKYEKYTVPIVISQINLMDLSLDKSRIKELYSLGYDAVVNKFG